MRPPKIRPEPLGSPSLLPGSVPYRCTTATNLSTAVWNCTKTAGRIAHSAGGTNLGRPGFWGGGPPVGGGGGGGCGPEERLELAVGPHAVAIAPNVDDVTVMHEPVDQRAGHDVVPEDLAPLLEALVAREHGGGPLVAPAHQVKEEHRPRAADREVADLVHHEERGEDERLQSLTESAGGLGFFERGDEVGEGAVVDPAPALGTRDREADRQVRLADARRPEEDHVFLALNEAERVEAVDLLALERGLEGEVEVDERLHGGEARGAHRGHKTSLIAETDLRPEHRGDGLGRSEPAPIDVGEDRVQGFERPGHFQVRELGAEALAHGGRRRGAHGLTAARAA